MVDGEQADESPSSDPPQRMTVERVVNRDATANRGLSTLHEMDLVGPSGAAISLRRRLPPGAHTVAYQALRQARPVYFSKCPICFEDDPQSKEHVPPRALGGSVMTTTCYRCNNDLGSRVEAPLLDWFEDAAHVSFRGESAPGFRRAPRLLVRETDAGIPGLVFGAGRGDPEVADILRSGLFEMLEKPLDKVAVRLAALKSAYLAACLLFEGIPVSAKAEEARALLVAARDSTVRSELPRGRMLDELKIGRSFAPANGRIELVVPTGSDDLVDLTVSLMGTLSVSWPLEPFDDFIVSEASGFDRTLA